MRARLKEGAEPLHPPPPHHSTQAKKLGQSWRGRAPGNEGPLSARGLEVCVWLLQGLRRMGRGVCVSQELQRTAKENRDEVENPNLGHEVRNEEQAQRTETSE